MNLEQNICDTVKEWELKIGYMEQEIQLYYPEDSLCELLDTKPVELMGEFGKFSEEVKEKYGKMILSKTEEEGRFCVRIPAKGAAYIHKHAAQSEFLKDFLGVITLPGTRLEDVVTVFKKYSRQVIVNREETAKWGIYFTDPDIDPYVYYVEENDFGLEYHRFTRKAYERLFIL